MKKKNLNLIFLIGLCLIVLSTLQITIVNIMSPLSKAMFPKVLVEYINKIIYIVFLFGVGYLIVTFVIYLALSIVSWQNIKAYIKKYSSLKLTDDIQGISVLIPARNESTTILNSIYSVLKQDYAVFEIIIINDGSEDETLKILKEEFNLLPISKPYKSIISTTSVDSIYESRNDNKLIVIDKPQSGKSDSLNTGINFAQYPLICTMDADTILAPQALWEIAKPALDSSEVVAVSGTLKFSNDSIFKKGELKKLIRPRRTLVKFQIVEYLRDFTHRNGWTSLDSLLLISGSFGLFKKDAVIQLGGFSSDTITEDLDMVFRIHRHFRSTHQPYKIVSSPLATAWTQVPQDLRSLGSQRKRWIVGLAECLNKHTSVLLNWRYGFVGFLAVPFFFLELILPILVTFNCFLLILSSLFFWTFVIKWEIIIYFLALAIVADTLSNWAVIFLNQLIYKSERKKYYSLYALSVLENFGYKQFLYFVQTKSLLDWFTEVAKNWGKIRRTKIAAAR